MRLEVEGLMTKETRGFVVRVRTPEEILDICEARIALEATVARSAAARRTEFDLAKLQHLLDSTRDSAARNGSTDTRNGMSHYAMPPTTRPRWN